MNKSLYVDIPIGLYEALEAHCFTNKVSKKDVVIHQLEKLLTKAPPRAKATTQIIEEAREKGNMKFEL